MNNQSNPFNMFGHTYQSHSTPQPPNYPPSNSNQYNHPPNYPPQNMNFPHSTTHTYGGLNNVSHNSFMHQPSNTPKQESAQNNGPQLENYDTSINIEKLSPKQLLCECIDLATSMLKQVVDAYTSNNDLKSPYQGRVNLDLIKKVIDFSLLANYILDPSRLETILTQFLAQDDQSVKALVKSWIFELKYIRNLWAHSQKVNYRLAFRGYDTLGLLFDSFGGDQNSDLYRKIETYRKALLVAQVKSGIF